VNEPAARMGWSPRRQRIGVVVWISFLAAAVETMVFFGFFDPAALRMDAQPETPFALRHAAYAAGFFFFWVFTGVAAGLTAYLLNTAGRRP